MKDGISELAPDAVVRVGGWNPAYARVLLVEQDGDLALVVIDGNGDGAELELEYWQRNADGLWRGGSTSGHGSLSDMPSAQSWNAGDFVVAVGRAEPSAEVSVEYGAHVYRRQAGESGTWGFIHAADAARSDELPVVAAGPPPK